MAMVEFANALRKKITRNEVTPEDAIGFLEEYSYKAAVINQNPYLTHALQISVSTGVSVYDSMFIAVALKDGYDLVSSDDKQIRIAKELGIRTIKC